MSVIGHDVILSIEACRDKVSRDSIVTTLLDSLLEAMGGDATRIILAVDNSKPPDFDGGYVLSNRRARVIE